MRMLDLLESVKTVADLPNFGYQEATRQWLSGVISTAWSIPSNSPNGVIDDATVQFISQLAGSIELFEPLYRVLLYRLPSNRTLTPEEALIAVRPIAEQAKASGVNALAVLRVIEALADLVRFIRDQ
jgi:hypothetical protein